MGFTLKARHGLAAVLLFWLCASCTPTANSPEIEFPANGASFEEGQDITLIANEEGSWVSDLAGNLGSGKSLHAQLAVGDHKIVFTGTEGAEASISIQVTPIALEIGSTAYLAATQSGSSRTIPAGTYASFEYSIAESSYALNLSYPAQFASLCQKQATLTNTDTAPGMGIPTPPRPVVPRLSARAVSRLSKKARGLKAIKGVNPANLGDEREWRMANPSLGTMSPGYSLRAKLQEIIGNREIWVDESSTVSPSDFYAFTADVAGIALPRAEAIWGERQDKNGDGRFAILVSGKLNDGEIAIGFFNPCDYLAYNDDSTQDDYNPTSNETDVIYVGVPKSDDANYSPKAIAATVAHEYQHLVRFGKKTYLPLVAGDSSAAQEDTAFDEGMSHLTETLVGFGCSGGNALFARRYLLSPASYSLKNADIGGAQDSVGKRGADALFFSWLLRKAGGISWKADAPLTLDAANSGGLTFLRATLSNSASGWDLIETSFGKSLSSLFREYIETENNINAGISPAPSQVMDSLTGEPLCLHSHLGSFVFGGSTYELNGPTLADLSSAVTLASWSVNFIKPIEGSEAQTVSASSTESAAGTLFWGLTREQ
jgi:hypothetical protein